MMFWPLDRWLGVTCISVQVCVFFLEVCLFYHPPSLIAVILWIVIMKSHSDACLSQQNTEHFPKKKRWKGRLRKINRKIVCDIYCYVQFQCFSFFFFKPVISSLLYNYTDRGKLQHYNLHHHAAITPSSSCFDCLCTGKSLTIHCQKYTLHGKHMQMLNMTADQLVHSSTAGSV